MANVKIAHKQKDRQKQYDPNHISWGLKIKHLIKIKLITQAYSVTYFKPALPMHLLSTLANTAMDLYCSTITSTAVKTHA